MAVTNTAPTGSTLWSKAFWKGAAERAIKTFAESVIGSFGVLEGANLLTSGEAESALSVQTWEAALLIALVNAVLSLFFSIANPDFVAGEQSTPQTAALASPAPEAMVIPDGDGEHRAGSPATVESAEPSTYEVQAETTEATGSTATVAPVIHEN